MRYIILLAAGIIDLLANIPYIIDTYKGKTKPNIASWSTWVLINAIVVLAAVFAGNAINTVVFGATYFTGALVILTIAIFKGTRKYTLFDVLCQATAIFGVVLWQLSNNPNIALVFALIADIFAALPTIKHANKYPKEETWSTYLIASAAGFIVIFAATSYNFAALAVPIEYCLVNGLLAAIILYKRRT